MRTETDAHPMRFLCIGRHDLGILSPVDPDHRGLGRRRHSDSPKRRRDRHSRRLKSPKDEEDDSIDRIVDMALRAPIQLEIDFGIENVIEIEMGIEVRF